MGIYNIIENFSCRYEELTKLKSIFMQSVNTKLISNHKHLMNIFINQSKIKFNNITKIHENSKCH